MNWSFEWCESRRILRVTTGGIFSLQEQSRMFEEILKLDGWQTGIPILFDNREIEMKDVNYDVIRQSVAVVRNFNQLHSNAPIAGIVKLNINFGFGRQFESIYEFAGGAAFRIFVDEELAIDWLTRSIEQEESNLAN